MNHGSLFSGIGGFDLAAEWMGWNNVFHCEWNPFGQRVLKHYWPNAKSYNDITKSDFSIHRGQIDILTGGFPCQPYSSAGKRLGKEDDRHLWPEMLRAIREIQPRWVVGENVRGLTNWNGGLVFDEVQADLENEGYEVTPFLLPACAIGAPHQRDRIWFVAYSSSVGGIQYEQRGDLLNREQNIQIQEERKVINDGTQRGSYESATTNTKSGGRGICISENIREVTRNEHTFGYKNQVSAHGWRDFAGFPTQSPFCIGDDGVSSELDGIAFSDWRQESVKAAGNAIVPQVAIQIFKSIFQYENLQKQLEIFAG